ncbi:MAG: nuclear transport factor 2 family protein [Ferruginibacter sp.]
MQFFPILILLFMICGCKAPVIPVTASGSFQQIKINEENITPTVDIKSFVLITNDRAKDSMEAREIMKVKRNFPLAMQQKDSSLFEQILATGFIFRADDEFFNRADYIQNRIHGTWSIDTVRYENLALQFFGEMAVLTYKNSLNGSDDAGRPNLEKYTWADMYVKEHGKWKLLSVHCIDTKIEYPGQ